MRLLKLTLLSASLTAALLAQQPAGPPSSTLKVGDTAPDFTLPSTQGGTPCPSPSAISRSCVHLADYLGKNTVVVAFYVASFTGG